jgi:hypothetical protein
MRVLTMLAVIALLASACGDTSGEDETASTSAPPAGASTSTTASTDGVSAGDDAPFGVSQVGYPYPPAPDVPNGAASDELTADLDQAMSSLVVEPDIDAIARIGTHDDARAAWVLSDILRFVPFGAAAEAAVDAFQELTGAVIADDPATVRSTWQSVTNHLVAWDLPSLPGYVEWKRVPFEFIEPRWEPFFSDTDAEIDWRLLSWGGVLIDDRPLGDPEPCARSCIPALDDPAVTSAEDGSWYPDESIVFGVVVNDEARAYPKNMMEIHEMVNDTIGGRRLAIPYCTLCGSAQAYLTDEVPGHDDLVMRTSGLLVRSNKVMYDLTTWSVFDTFLGDAVSGPLQDEDVQLQQVSVVTSTWGDWREAHPHTTIVARDGGVGRVYPEDPLGGRDDNGPIFPVGDVDPRLPAQASVLGVTAPDGTVVAFPVEMAIAELAAGRDVELAGVRVVADGGGVRAQTPDGDDLPGHQAFWFAWSQFMPDTVVWTPLG